ncbi:hypothetical protein GCM10023063_36590 [Arthrobacter methylotrophus]|uniref:Carboxymuconolactone decarboxylase family protein n=1 Tax=Arthrobacter methylotrophus TaxID=121291 RepID=A0ABV5UK13_9MICC
MTSISTTAASDANVRECVAQALEGLIGSLDAQWQAAVDIDHDFVRAYIALAQVPERKSRLDPVSRALISLAVSASVTTLDPAGIRTAAVQAQRAGATRAQALEAIHLVSVLGVHSLVTGFPEVAAVLKGHGEQLVSEQPLSAAQLELKDHFETRRGYWSSMNEMLLRVDQDMFAAYTEYSSHPWVHGELSPKLRELIYIAIDLSPTHLFTAGVGPHIENAIRYGATTEEIVETLEVTALVGISSLRTSAPIIQEVFG